MTEGTVRVRFTGRPDQFLNGYPPEDGEYPADEAQALIDSGIYTAVKSRESANEYVLPAPSPRAPSAASAVISPSAPKETS